MLRKTSPTCLSSFCFCIYKLESGFSQEQKIHTHLSAFLRGVQRAWSNSSPTNPQAVDVHKYILISCQSKNCFSFLFSLWNEGVSPGSYLRSCQSAGKEDRLISSGCLKASVLKNYIFYSFTKTIPDIISCVAQNAWKQKVGLIPSYLYDTWNNILLECWGTLAARWMQCKQKMTQDDSKEYEHSNKTLRVCVCKILVLYVYKKVWTRREESFSAGSAWSVLCPDPCHIE